MQSDSFSQIFDEFERLDTESSQHLNSYWYQVIQGKIKCAVLGNLSACSLLITSYNTSALVLYLADSVAHYLTLREF